MEEVGGEQGGLPRCEIGEWKLQKKGKDWYLLLPASVQLSNGGEERVGGHLLAKRLREQVSNDIATANPITLFALASALVIRSAVVGEYES